MAHEKLKALIERARIENMVLYCRDNGYYYTPDEMIELNNDGKLLWSVEFFTLRPFSEYPKSEIKKVPKGILYFPVAECGTVRIFSDDISFWYYEKKSMQTMVHLKSGDCLRVEQDIETVDQKIMDSKAPAIGNELAKFWEELLTDTYNNKNLEQNERDARNGR